MNWISVNHKMPQLHLDVLVIDNKKDCWVAFRDESYINQNGYWMFKTENENCCFCVCPEFVKTIEQTELRKGEFITNRRYITHWMPLPDIPKD